MANGGQQQHAPTVTTPTPPPSPFPSIPGATAVPNSLKPPPRVMLVPPPLNEVRPCSWSECCEGRRRSTSPCPESCYGAFSFRGPQSKCRCFQSLC